MEYKILWYLKSYRIFIEIISLWIVSPFLLLTLECSGDTYGNECSQIRGKCYKGEQCHHVNGMCPHGCDVGFVGENCVTGT